MALTDNGMQQGANAGWYEKLLKACGEPLKPYKADDPERPEPDPYAGMVEVADRLMDARPGLFAPRAVKQP